jgi:D-glycero-alpha-D-manno-heptose-7-phosphate kinase
VFGARAPLRISFAGGGTDVAEYYDNFDGMVVSIAISSYVNVQMSPLSSASGNAFVLRDLSQGAEVKSRDYVDAAFARFHTSSDYDMEISRDLPSGLGLGSSSALSVALSAALLAQADRPHGASDVAEAAAAMEIEQLGMPIGKQDHYASAFGGLNAIYFRKDGVEVERLTVSPVVRDWLQSYLMLFSFAQRHDSREILSEQRQRTATDSRVLEALHQIRDHAIAVRQAIVDDDPERIGQIINSSWQAKRQIASGITNADIDAACAAALDAGAVGCKVTGAGGGGCLLVVCAPTRHNAVKSELQQHGLTPRGLGFDFQGAQVLSSQAPAISTVP